MSAAPLLFMVLIFDFGGSHTESDTIHTLEIEVTLFHTPARITVLVRIKTTSAW